MIDDAMIKHNWCDDLATLVDTQGDINKTCMDIFQVSIQDQDFRKHIKDIAKLPLFKSRVIDYQKVVNKEEKDDKPDKASSSSAARSAETPDGKRRKLMRLGSLSDVVVPESMKPKAAAALLPGSAGQADRATNPASGQEEATAHGGSTAAKAPPAVVPGGLGMGERFPFDRHDHEHEG